MNKITFVFVINFFNETFSVHIDKDFDSITIVHICVFQISVSCSLWINSYLKQ